MVNLTLILTGIIVNLLVEKHLKCNQTQIESMDSKLKEIKMKIIRKLLSISHELINRITETKMIIKKNENEKNYFLY
jgi:hypothetical protein